jgi:Putative beta-barrel porin-2, OmpL-like. bbp2
MKFNINKWTLGLAAVGAVSMASAVRADDAPKLSPVETALSSTVISGYVSASANYEPSPANVAASIGGAIPLQAGKANGFNLDVVGISIAKAQDDSPWAAGYQVDLAIGPDAVGWNPSPGAANSELSIAQAYVALRTPVGNGIDWKIGVFNTVVGYEAFAPAANPNYTRSWGWAVEPTEHTGILATYKVVDALTVSAGIANTLGAGINTRNTYITYGNGSPSEKSAWTKTFMGSVTLTAPSSWGWASGSALYAGVVYGFANTSAYSKFGAGGQEGGNQANYYLGSTLNTPWKSVSFGASLDYVQNLGGGAFGNNGLRIHGNDIIVAVYNTVHVTDKLSLNSRAEYWEADAAGSINPSLTGSDNGIALTGTIEYDLWANVVSRIEARYDHVMGGTWAGSVGYFAPTGASVTRTSVGLYANVVYKF